MLNEDDIIDFNENSLFKNMIITQSLEKSFKNLSNPKTLILPKTIRFIDENSFYYCYINEIIFPIDSVIIELDDKAFYNCRAKYIKLPNSIRKLGESCFENCVSLINIELPDEITEIPSKCFYYCNSLNSIKLPKKLQIINDYAFTHCNSLQKMIMYSNMMLNISPLAFDIGYMYMLDFWMEHRVKFIN